MNHSSFLLAFALFFLSAGFTQEIHVSIKGNDRNPGSIDRPLASLEAARDLARKIKTNGVNTESGTKIIIHGGQYQLNTSLLLDERDGGSDEAPSIWTAAAGEDVRITGGISLSAKKFTPVQNKQARNRLLANVRDNVLEIDLHALGIRNFGKHIQYGHGLSVVASPMELFFNGAPMTLAQYPNKGSMKIGKVIDMGSVPRIGDKSNRGAVFTYTDDRHVTWAGQEDIWIQGTFNYGFADDYSQIANIDTVNKLVKLAKPHLYGVASGMDFQSYTAINILEELDSPGEWYADPNTGMLYFWPPASLKNETIQLSILEAPIISIEGVRNLSIEGITIEVGRGMGIYMERCNSVVIAGCTIRNLGTCGILMGQGARVLDETSSIDDYEGIPQSREIGSLQNHFYSNNAWNRNAGEQNGILSCEIYNTGSGGVFLSGGDKKTLHRGNSYVENCKVHNYNRRNNYS